MMKLLAAVLSLVGLLNASAFGQAVQLPTFHQFSASTTVVVPDRGSVLLGGVNGAASGSNQFGGFPGNRSFGGSASASSARMFVQIHDFDAMDRALLEEARARRLAHGSSGDAGSIANWHRHSAHHVPSVAEINERKTTAQPAASDAESLLHRAAEAEAKGNLGAARVYLQMAARESTGPLREQALADYQRLKRK